MKKAFSLIETVIIVSIIAILFFISLPKLNFINRFVLQNEVEKLFSTFSYLQQRAIAANREQKVFFDVENNSYSYKGKGDKDVVHQFPGVIQFGFLQHAKGPPSKPTKIIKKSVTFKKDKKAKLRRIATCFPDGKISSGTVYLVDKDQKYMYALTVPVSQVSFIRMYRYDHDRWVCVK